MCSQLLFCIQALAPNTLKHQHLLQDLGVGIGLDVIQFDQSAGQPVPHPHFDENLLDDTALSMLDELTVLDRLDQSHTDDGAVQRCKCSQSTKARRNDNGRKAQALRGDVLVDFIMLWTELLLSGGFS